MIKKSISEILRNLTDDESISSDLAEAPVVISNGEAQHLSGGDRDYIPIYESVPLSKSFTLKPKMLFDSESGV